MGYTLRTKDDPLDLIRAADQNESVDNDILFNSQHLPAVCAWDPNKPPASPTANDDEFADGALGGMWSEYDPDNKTTWAEGNGGLTATILTHATTTLNGIHQDIPAGDFSIYAKVGLSVTNVNNTHINLCLWEDPTGDNEAFTWGIYRSTLTPYATYILGQTWTNRSTAAIAKVAGAVVGYSESIYLRIRRNAANYYADFSRDGIGWWPTGPHTFIFTPTKMGIGVINNNTLVTQYAHCQFFRYIASDVGVGGILAGNR